MCFDTATNRFWARRNGGAWHASGNPEAGTGGTLASNMNGLDWYAYMGATVKSADQRKVTANFGPTAFVYPIPTGFLGYDG